MNKKSIDPIKKAIGEKAADLIEDGMRVGLGTGSTAFYFIERLIHRCQEGLNIQAAVSSIQSLNQAKLGKIPLLDMNQITSLDVTVDGADEIDSEKRMIKGAGGALVREKIIASMSREMIVIVDESKCVHQLGNCKLPVEVIPFAHMATLHKIEKLGFTGAFRKKSDHSLYLTDNGNYILDLHFQTPLLQPEAVHESLIHLPGVVDTGFFFHLAGRVIVGFFDGQIIIRS